jgi:NADPH2:quinone reductase
MKAILMTATGTPDVLKFQDISEPQITTPDQVKIKIHAAGVNPIDTKIRRNGLLIDGVLPVILGCDGAGEVIEVGADVERFKAGDSVWYCHGGLGGESGNYAEYTVISQDHLAIKPQTLDYYQAATLPLVLITAWGALFDKGRLQAGETVLIHGGAGGVGHVAIQLAKQFKAQIITTVSSQEKADFVRNLGADEVIDYTRQDIKAEIDRLTDGQGADLVIDTIGPDVFRASIPLTRYYGRLITLLDPGPFETQEARKRNLLIGFELMLAPMLKDIPNQRQHHIDILNQCKKLIEQGHIQPHISRVFPLQDAALTHTLLQQGHTTGKMVLGITPPPYI